MIGAAQRPAHPVGEVNGPPSLSADGRYAAWLSSGDSAPGLVCYDVERRDRCRIDIAAARTRAFTWSYLPGVAVLAADPTGDETWSLYRLDVPSGRCVPLDAPRRAQLRVAGLSRRRPSRLLVAANGRDRRHHDYHLVSLETGAWTPVLTNTGYSAVYADDELRPRLVETVEANGSRLLWHAGTGRGRAFLRVPHEAAMCTRFSHFSPDGGVAYFVLPDGPDRTRLTGLRCVDGEPADPVETALEVRRADIVRVHHAPDTGRPDLVEVDRFRPRMVALDPALEPPLRALRRRLAGAPVVLQRRRDGRYWLVAEHRPDIDVRYHLYDAGRDELRALCAARPGREPLAVRCRVADVAMRDRRRAVTYITAPDPAAPDSAAPRPAAPDSAALGPAAPDSAAPRPAAARAKPARPDPPPAVLLVHGGPWRRSRWGYDERRARLAAQGLTVLEPNYRGSTGYGAGWVNAGDRQWGAAMRDDLEDTLDWAIGRGYADPARIALVGGSYGGYAVLQLAATSEREFRCVVATSPVTDLVAFVGSLPAYWQTAAPMVRRRVGDPADPDQHRALVRSSPVHHAASIRCPVLLVHGANDSRVPADMSARMFMALARADRTATLAVFPDEGHEIVGTENRSACDALTADFLARHLLGARPPARAFPGSTVKLLHTPRAGAEAGAYAVTRAPLPAATVTHAPLPAATATHAPPPAAAT